MEKQEDMAGGSKDKFKSAKICSNSDQRHRNQRSVGSLVLLTQKFVKLMKSKGGQIDLKTATDILDVQKRRIYDITNVLEGVGLIEKTRHSSIVRWRGDFTNKRENESLVAAYARINHLKALEKDLDLQLEYARKNLKNVKNDEINKSFAYITRDDLLAVYENNIVFTIPCDDDDMRIKRWDKSLSVSLDNGGTVDIRLVTDKGKCINQLSKHSKKRKKNCLNSCDNEQIPVNIDTPSPSSSNSTPVNTTETSVMTQEETFLKFTNSADLVTNEHTYYRDPEIKEKLDALEDEITKSIVLRNNTSGYSLRRLFPDDPNMENPPLLPVMPPRCDFSFALTADEGVCELFDIPGSL